MTTPRTLSLKSGDALCFIERKPRTNRFRLTFYPEGHFVLVVPLRATRERVERFFIEHMPWIERVHKKALTRPKKHLLTLPTHLAEYQQSLTKWTEARLAPLGAFYGCTPTRIRFRQQVSRWGSCSRRGVLNLNLKIGLLPADLAEYILVHELCHLRVFNHSAAFWKLVAQTIPHYKEQRKRLRQYALRSSSRAV